MRNLAITFIIWCVISFLAGCAQSDPTFGTRGPTLDASATPWVFYLDPTARAFVNINEQSTNFYNNYVGYPVMTAHTEVMDLEPDGAFVRINLVESDHGEAVRRFNGITGVFINAEINLPPGSSFERLIHEKGHVLGLAHDSDRTSCMHPEHPQGCEVADNDVEALRGAY